MRDKSACTFEAEGLKGPLCGQADSIGTRLPPEHHGAGGPLEQGRAGYGRVGQGRPGEVRVNGAAEDRAAYLEPEDARIEDSSTGIPRGVAASLWRSAPWRLVSIRLLKRAVG